MTPLGFLRDRVRSAVQRFAGEGQRALPPASELRKTKGMPNTVGVRRRYDASTTIGLTPAGLAQILVEAREGSGFNFLTLAYEVERRDPHYRSVLGTRRLALQGMPITVTPAGGEGADEEAQAFATLIEDTLVKKPAFRRMLPDLLDALGKGYGVVEIVWDSSDVTQWIPRYHWRDQRFFEYDDVTGMELRLRSDTKLLEGEALDDYKWIVHQPKLLSGYPLDGGLAVTVVALYLLKAYAMMDWGTFVEVFGIPLRVGKYGPESTDSEQEDFLSALVNLGADAAAIFPLDYEYEIHDASGSGGGKLGPHGNLSAFVNKEISKVVLGQTMSSEDGSSLAQAKVHDEVRGDILAADAVALEDTLNEYLIEPFVDLNYGPPADGNYPRVKIDVSDKEDLVAFAEALTPFVDRGLRVAAREVYNRFGLKEPASGEAVLMPRGSASAEGDESNTDAPTEGDSEDNEA